MTDATKAFMNCASVPDELDDRTANQIIQTHKHEAHELCFPLLAAWAYLSDPDPADWE